VQVGRRGVGLMVDGRVDSLGKYCACQRRIWSSMPDREYINGPYFFDLRSMVQIAHRQNCSIVSKKKKKQVWSHFLILAITRENYNGLG
jgi:hypothetical protein